MFLPQRLLLEGRGVGHFDIRILLLHLFLKRRYKKVDVVFIRHTHDAQEVDEHEFFYSRQSGGTIVSTARLAAESDESLADDARRRAGFTDAELAALSVTPAK